MIIHGANTISNHSLSPIRLLLRENHFDFKVLACICIEDERPRHRAKIWIS